MASETLQIIVTATDNATGVLGKISSTLSGLTQVAGGILLADTINKISDSLGTLISDGTNTLVFLQRMNAAFTQMVAADLRASDSTMSVADSMHYAAGAAMELNDWMIKLAIESPFQTEDIAKTFRTAKMYGFTADEAKKLTQDMVDLAAATGSTPFMMERVSLALGQIRLRGKLTGQEIRQLAEAGFPVDEMFKELGKTFGKSTAEIQDMQEKGLIPAKTALIAISDVMERNFGGAAKQQMTLLAGLISSFEDIRAIGGASFMKGLLAPFQNEIQNFILSIATPQFREAATRLGYMVAGGIKAGIELAKTAIGGLVSVFGNLPNRIAFFIGSIANGIKSGLDPITAVSQALSKNLGEGFGNAFLAVVRTIYSFASIIKRALTEIFAGDWVSALSTLFGEKVAGAIVPPLERIATFIETYIRPALNNLFSNISGSPDAFVQKILGMAAAFFVLRTAIGLGTAILSPLLTGLGLVLRVILTLAPALAAGFGAIPGIIGGIVTSIGGLAGSIAGIVGGIGSSIATVGTTISSIGIVVGTMLGTIGGAISGIGGLGLAIGAVVTALSPIIGIVIAIGAVIAALGIAFATAQNGASIFAGIMQGLGEIMSALAPLLQAIWTGLSTILIPALISLGGGLVQLSVQFADFLAHLVGFKEGLGGVGEVINRIASALKDQLIRQIDDLKVQFVEFLNIVIGVMKALGQDTSSMEASLNGIISSMSGASSGANALATSVAQSGAAMGSATGSAQAFSGTIEELIQKHLGAASAAYEQQRATERLMKMLGALRVPNTIANNFGIKMLTGILPESVQNMIVDRAYNTGAEFGQSIIDGAENSVKKGKSVVEKLSDQIRGLIDKALSPTDVEAKDQRRYEISKRLSELQGQLDEAGPGRTKQINSEIDALNRESDALGPYVDKWDEFRRRVEAVATGTSIDQFGATFRTQLEAVQGMFQGLNLDQIAAKFKDFSLFADKSKFKDLMNLGIVDFDALSGSIQQQIDAIIGKANVLREAFDRVWSNLDAGKKADLVKALGLDPSTAAETAAGAEQVFSAVTGEAAQSAQTNIQNIGSATKGFQTALTDAAGAAKGMPSSITALTISLTGFAESLARNIQAPVNSFKEAMESIRASFESLVKSVPATITEMEKLPKTLQTVDPDLATFLEKMDSWVGVNAAVLQGIKDLETEIDKLAAKLAGLDLGPFERHSPSELEQSLMGSNKHLLELLRLLPDVDFTRIRFSDFHLLGLNAETLAQQLFKAQEAIDALKKDPTKWNDVNGDLDTTLGLLQEIVATGAEMPEGFKAGIESVIDDLVSVGKIAPEVARQMKDKLKDAATPSGAGASAGENLQPVVDAIKALSTDLRDMLSDINREFEDIIIRVENAIASLMPKGLADAWMEVANAILLATQNLQGMRLPDFLVRHSPSELETALWNSHDALVAINTATEAFSMGQLSGLAGVNLNLAEQVGSSEQQVGVMGYGKHEVHNHHEVYVDRVELRDVTNARQLFNQIKNQADTHARMGE